MRRGRWHCKPCHKTSFPSEGQAQGAVDYYQTVVEDGAHDKPKRVYPCPYGNGYHVTKQDERRTA